MSPEPQTQSKSLPVATVEDVIFQEEFLLLQGLQEQRQYFLKVLARECAVVHVS